MYISVRFISYYKLNGFMRRVKLLISLFYYGVVSLF